MSSASQFDSGARTEYHEAIRYYATQAEDAEVATQFVAAVESALAAVCAAPEMWRVVEPPDLRRYVLRRFPFVLYYRYHPAQSLVVVYAIMHTSRQPHYWRGRLPSSP